MHTHTAYIVCTLDAYRDTPVRRILSIYKNSDTLYYIIFLVFIHTQTHTYFLQMKSRRGLAMLA